jgi:hypothetical protein
LDLDESGLVQDTRSVFGFVHLLEGNFIATPSVRQNGVPWNDSAKLMEFQGISIKQPHFVTI